MPTLSGSVPVKETGRGIKEWPVQQGRWKPKCVLSGK